MPADPIDLDDCDHGAPTYADCLDHMTRRPLPPEVLAAGEDPSAYVVTGRARPVRTMRVAHHRKSVIGGTDVR